MNTAESEKEKEREEVDEESFEKFREERQREVDRLSLELLSNTKHYKKYIAKNRPEEQQKRIEDSRRFLKYKSRITALFIELLDEYDREEDEDAPDSICDVSPEFRSQFKEMVQKTIQHLEWTEYSHSEKSNEFDDEDMMFAYTGGFSAPKFNVRKKRQPQQQHLVEENPYSYWGATIRKSESNDGGR